MKSTLFAFRTFALSFLFAGALAQAATVTGTVTDKTTGKPAAGDTVVLVEPMSGMSEVGHATTDAKGHYSFNLPGSNPYLIRVMHQGAEYFVDAPQGGGTGDVSVYDVAAKVDGVTISERVVGIESDNGQLRVVERYDVHNESTPPRTQWSKRSFEVILPEDAVLGGVSAQRPGAESLPTSVTLDPDGPKGHYSFNFPIQPDEGGKGTLFQIQYNLPYSSGKYTFHSLVTLPADTMWVVLAKSMTFSGAGFEPSSAGSDRADFYDAQCHAGQGDRRFRFREPDRSRARIRMRKAITARRRAAGRPAGRRNRPPINTPDPLSKYKWWILAGLALLLAAIAAFLLRKPAGDRNGSTCGAAAAGLPAVHASPTTPAAKNAALLNALKEELFALESERIAGTLPQDEYAEQKAALEIVLKRALKKS